MNLDKLDYNFRKTQHGLTNNWSKQPSKKEMHLAQQFEEDVISIQMQMGKDNAIHIGEDMLETEPDQSPRSLLQSRKSEKYESMFED